MLLGPALFAGILLAPAPPDLAPPAWRTAALALLMATWWITEAIPIPATALLPIALLPLLRIASVEAATSPYANPVIYLFLGGFLLAAGMQRWGLHRRVAMGVLSRIGGGPARLVFGFMAATAFVSMWVSNTATTAMMLPIAISVTELARRDGRGDDGPSNFDTCLMLGVAYGASIGGLGTLVGTPPNALLAAYFSESFGVRVGFAEWLLLGLPLVAVLLPLAWLLLVRVFPLRGAPAPAEVPAGADAAGRGPWTAGERRMAVIFVATALAWVTQPLLARAVPGVSDTTIAIAAGVAMFLVPVDLRRGEFVLDWSTAAGIPWAVLVLFGGGLSLADAIRSTGLSTWIGAGLSGLDAFPPFALVVAVTFVMIFLTEITSNTASAAAFLPVLASLAIGLGENPFLFAVPAVVAASCAFMLPVATPPNALVFASGRVTIARMARAGLVLNLVLGAVVAVGTWFLARLVFGAEPGVLPPWAQPGGGP